MRYTLGEQQERNIFASRYQLYLPTAEELQRELMRERRLIAGVPAIAGVGRQRGAVGVAKAAKKARASAGRKR